MDEKLYDLFYKAINQEVIDQLNKEDLYKVNKILKKIKY
tara:strand:+ start:669 stop:785 length:117 start_codon:yes stop_codon:yes gene_type:complete